MTPSSTPAAREFELRFNQFADCPVVTVKSPTAFVRFNEAIHVIEYSAFEAIRRERDDALSVAAGIEEQAKKNSEYDDWRIEKLQVELARYKRALEYAKLNAHGAIRAHYSQIGKEYLAAPRINEINAEIERILGVDSAPEGGKTGL